MGKFDLEDLLRDLGKPDPAAPKEPSPGSVSPPAGGESPASSLFVRNDPAETPRPPDLTGAGLGNAQSAEKRGSDAPDPMRVRPDDGLAPCTDTGCEVTRRVRGTPAELVALLTERSSLNNEMLASIERLQKQTPGRRIAGLLVEVGVDEVLVQQAIADLAHLPFERIDVHNNAAVDARSLAKLTPEFCQSNLVLPLRRENGRVIVATPRPDDVFLLDDVKRRLGASSIRHVLTVGSDIVGYLEVLKASEEEDTSVDEILSDVDEDDVEVVKEKVDDDSEAGDAESSPVVRLVNHIIQTALKEGASDIHIEPDEKTLKVRFRIDGILFEMMTPPRKMHAALTSRIKIMANLDIAERRLPQDGRIRATVMGRKIDLRVSTVPTPKGEKTVMRILDNKSINVTLDQLGFHEDTLTIWKNQIDQPHGIILVTGPTGSGKTTTLYASLQQLDLRRMNVSTVEDPVEYNLAGITQIQTHERIGMTFSAALRALLRQDPDVVMVGEIRDQETATIAIQASMTGHLVLSTLHTNDAPSSITRLINIGIEPFLVAAACNGVLAQRLVRRICPQCKSEEPVPEHLADFIAVHGLTSPTLPRGKGCGKCRETGYSGRLGVYELLVLDDYLRDLVARSPNVTEFRRQCSERGMVTLREDGFRKVKQGNTTVEEILRVTESTI